MYTHLMALEDCKRASRSCGTTQKAEMFNRLLEIALEQDTNLEQVLEDNGDLKDKITLLEKKVTELEEYKYMYESVSK
jgi:hypothetical protein